jgi:predicted nucleotidyltransferase
MRLSAHQADAIKRAALQAFGPDAVVRLFGSRVDDDRRGGDIDIHIEAAPEKADVDHEVQFRALIWKWLDEEQIDVVVSQRGAKPRWIDEAAKRDGIIL